MVSKRVYHPQIDAAKGEQSFHANYVVVQKEEGEWLVAFGDLDGDDARGNMRPPIHHVLVFVQRGETPRSPWTLSFEFNGQGNTRDAEEIESFAVTRDEVRIRVRAGAELVSGRVSYTPSADPLDPEGDPDAEPIRSVRMSFKCDDATYKSIVRTLRKVRAPWLEIN